jgi:hypothetical protein
MVRHNRTRLSVVSLLGAVLARLGFLTLFSNLQWLTSLIPVGCQVLLGCAVLDHRLSPCPVQVLVDLCALLQTLTSLC